MAIRNFEGDQFLLIFTNVISWLLVGAFLLAAIFIERKRLTETKILHISIVGTICGLSAILTNLLGYNISIFSLSIKLALGQWLIFIVGIFYGPTLGVVAGICGDLVGSLLGLGGGAFHAGFMLCSVIIGFAGGVTLLFGKKHILLKGAILYSLAYILQSIVLNPIWLFSMRYGEYVYVDMALKLIKLPISLAIYISLISATFFLFIQIIKRMNDEDCWWYLKTKGTGVVNEI
ncbi:folate family ECF transporter S component [Spiroplasma sp. TIUS-1]|uniref:folate family ECF transporter S component n=1 Tax=Spiroplasma sp. TIUS-1 TaxID=216963 RepID=UPI0013971CCA|nr:folate family ECF transporter S component [Spiroplasma sp. TIUS-1]QHX36188.1 folate family ECF transporter S component [Spiroplasma sp. TIUS-1]